MLLRPMSITSARVVFVKVVLQRIPSTAYSNHHVIAQNLKVKL